MKSIKIIIAALLAFAATGCATTATPPDEVKEAPRQNIYLNNYTASPDFIRIIVTRDQGYAGHACSAGVYIDGRLAAKLDTSERVTFWMPPKEVLVGVGPAERTGFCSAGLGMREVATNPKAGETRMFRVVVRPGDGLGIEATSGR